jgi:serine/threonine protein kinase
MAERFDDLVLAEKLAAGGMAEVYRAVQLGYGGFEKQVAVKRILPHFASDEEFKNMFMMEANLSGLLQHPNVVHIYGNGEFEGYLYLVMEFVDGKNVRQLLARADKLKIRIPIEYSCFVIAEAAKGLEYAHNFVDEKSGQSLNIVHRDMSPQNIMLSYDGAIKIVDFGIAKAAARSENTRAGVLKGKFGYMSPEQAQGMQIDKRTDVFALGIIFFELLTQRRLFSHDDDLRTLQLVRECNVPRPSKYNPNVSPALDRIVLKALAKNRNERYQSAGEFYADVQRFMNQKYSQFLPSEFSKFLRAKIFDQDIVNEKKKREQIAAEAPPRMASGKKSAADAAAKAGAEDTGVDLKGTQITGLSEIGEAPVDSPMSVPLRSGVMQLESVSQSEPSDEPAKSRSPLSPAPPQSATRITDDFEEDDLPAPGKALQLEEESKQPENAAFPQGSGPSHLSLSMTAAEASRARASIPRTLPKASDAPRRASAAETWPGGVPKALVSDARAQLPAPPPLKSIAMTPRTFLFYLAIVAGGYYLYSQKESGSGEVPVANVGTQPETPAPVDVAVPPVDNSIAQGTTDPTPTDPADPNSATQPNVDRAPAALPPGMIAYEPKGPTGLLEIHVFPTASEVLVDGKVLVDASGAPVSAPFQSPQRLEAGKHRLTVRNQTFKIQWQGDVEIRVNQIEKLEVRLK